MEKNNYETGHFEHHHVAIATEVTTSTPRLVPEWR